MPYALGQIAEAIGAQLQGDPGIVINSLATLETAQAGDLSYILSPKFRKALDYTKASALIIYPNFKNIDRPALVIKDPRLGFARAMRLFHRAYPQTTPGIEKSAQIAPDVVIPRDAYIGHNAVISRGVNLGAASVISAGVFIGEGTTLGCNCYIFPNVTIREKIRIGNNVVIYPNAVIGSDGFGYAWDGTRHVKIPQAGTVIIEDDVEIGAGTTIDRATLGETIIGRGTIIDNLVQIAHNCKIGEYSILCAQVGLAGTTTLGKYVTLAGQVGLAGHLEIGDGVTVLAQSGVAGDIPAGAVYFGTPAKEAKLAQKIEAIINRLPEYVVRLRKLESFFKKNP
jgi:UDP-3-O-[3-hydroxymyristoyl] glucosamine N-acyltransferase